MSVIQVIPDNYEIKSTYHSSATKCTVLCNLLDKGCVLLPLLLFKNKLHGEETHQKSNVSTKPAGHFHLISLI